LLTLGILGMLAFDRCRADETISFRSHIAPILRDACLACHNAKKAEGSYRVDSYAELIKAGDSGEPPVATIEEGGGEFLRRITCDDDFERMPADSDPLSPEQTERIRAWVVAGSQFDGDDPRRGLLHVIPPVKHQDPPASYPRPIPLAAIAGTPDGQQVVVSGYHEVTVWNLRDGRLARRIPNIGQRVYALAFSEDGETLAVGCGQPGRYGEVRLVHFHSGTLRAVVARAEDVVLDVAFRPGTAEIAVASADNLIRIVDTVSLEEVRTLASHADWVSCVCWDHEGSRLASASRDQSVKVFDADSGSLLTSYQGHRAAVRGVTFLADGQQLVSIGADKKLHRWKCEDATKVAEVALGAEGYKPLRNEADIFVPLANNRLLRIDMETNQIAHQYQGHTDWVLSAALVESVGPKSAASPSAATRQLASGAFNGELILWELDEATRFRSWLAIP